MNEDFKEKLNTSKKKIYINKSYIVTIYCDFNYVTVLIEDV